MAHVIIVGLGAIGSHVVSHVARMADVTEVTVVDPDRYEPKNLRAQNISRTDVGRSKAQAQARRIALVNHGIRVRPYHGRIEDMPLGRLRADVILGCVDSRRGRMAINQAAWRLGIPWINAGVDADGLLTRVQVFQPSSEAPCLECAWSQRDYDLVEQVYACQSDAASPETGAPSALGALAAALQALECEKLLTGGAHLLESRDVIVDARHHRHSVTRFLRNSNCRMPDHDGWRISPLDLDPSAATIDDLFAASGAQPDTRHAVRLRVAEQRFALTVTCARCGERTACGHIYRGALRDNPEQCRLCGGRLTAAGFALHEAIARDALPEVTARRPLSALGFADGDIVTFESAGADTHLELRGATWLTES